MSLIVLLGFVSCNGMTGLKGWGGEIMVAMLGYESEVEGADRGFEHSELFEGDNNFIGFTDQESYDSVQDQKMELPRNRFEYSSEERRMVVKTYPKMAVVNKISITSSDPSILEVVSVKDGEAVIKTHKLGDVNMHIRVEGPMNVIENDYPVRVYYPVEIDFYITPYWFRGLLNTRIRYKIVNMPPQEKELVTQVQDSVSVVGYCQYYDFNDSRSPKVIRDTVRFGMEEKVDRFRKNHRLLLRNVTSAFRHFREKHVIGNAYVWDELAGDYVLKDKEYDFSVEQVILDFNVISPNPYVDFHLVSKYDLTFDHYNEETGEIEDEGTDDPVDDGGVDNQQELTKEEIVYFKILLNAFMTDSERQSMIDDLNRQLDEIGFTAELSDEEKDRQLEEINKHKRDGDE